MFFNLIQSRPFLSVMHQYLGFPHFVTIVLLNAQETFVLINNPQQMVVNAETFSKLLPFALLSSPFLLFSNFVADLSIEESCGGLITQNNYGCCSCITSSR